MKAYIHYVGDRPFSSDCASAERGLTKLGFDCVRFSNDEDLAYADAEDMIVAGLLVTNGRLHSLGISPAAIEYPEQLRKYLRRTIWQDTVGNLESGIHWPVFVKPVEEKLLGGRVVSSPKDLVKYREADQRMELWCSDVLELESEWRCYVQDGRALGIIPYIRRKPNSRFDETIIESAVRDLGRHPAGCALDFGVTMDGETVLIEANDGYSLGNYGLDDALYVSLLAARWEELISQRRHLANMLPLTHHFTANGGKMMAVKREEPHDLPTTFRTQRPDRRTLHGDCRTRRDAGP